MAPWLLLLAAACCPLGLATQPQLYCYHDSQAYWRRGSAQFRIRDLEESLEYCDKLVYGFAVVDPTSFQVKPLDSFLDSDEGRQHYRHVTNLKRPFPELQVLLSIGGRADTQQSSKYLTLLESAENRTAFISSARAMVRRYGFDGVELAWPFPELPPSRRAGFLGRFWESLKDYLSGRSKARRQKELQHRNGFSALVRDLKAVLQQDDMLLTAVAYPLVNNTAYFDIGEVMRHLDAVVLRAFDFTTPDRNHTAADLTAPLNATEHPGVPMSVVGMVQEWLKHGAPASKLVLGVPSYGRTWQVLEAPGNKSLPLAADGPGEAGPLTRTPGLLAFTEVCGNLTDGSCRMTPVMSQTQRDTQVGLRAYCRATRTWVALDDPEMAAAKARYARDACLGGLQLVDLSLDDFAGRCGLGAYPVLSEARCALRGDC
ncbi:chitinase-like protein Idgf4 [Bacillus rossius redtenbacheri]|uniref:chitinase-like protein Idgf4 n=1 Tax=Bacillus rossius redtenbacheri TaxID=93214 RepID=UPI002FDDACAA